MARVDIRERLLKNESKLHVWGNGYIGYTTLAYFASQGIQCLGYDPNENVVEKINNGEIPVEGLSDWIDVDVKELSKVGLLQSTTDLNNLFTHEAVHTVSVPTERDGNPWSGPLRKTVNEIFNRSEENNLRSVTIIIESTLVPGTTKEIIKPRAKESHIPNKDVDLIVAPRRDWFVSKEKNLRTLPRVVGGNSSEATSRGAEVLGIVCNNIVKADNHYQAELVKSIENAYRHMGITLANQLNRAYDNVNMRETLRLVGTKWNVETYYPSIGTGGYCIPISSKYVLEGASHQDDLTLLKTTLATDQEQPSRLADLLVQYGVNDVAILGLAYKSDIPVDEQSPTKRLSKTLFDHEVPSYIHDPYYSREYIKNKTKSNYLENAIDAFQHDALVVVSAHNSYESVIDSLQIDNIPCEIIVNNTELWDDYRFKNSEIEYITIGDSGSLGSISHN